MTYSAAQFRDRIRLFLKDGSTDHRVAPDDLSDQVDGVRTQFFLANKNIVALPAPMLSKDGAAFTAAGFTVDSASGLVTCVAIGVPAASLLAFYYYQFFSDAEVDALRDHGVERCTIKVADFSTVPEGLFSAVCNYAAAAGYRALASRFSTQYDVSVESKSASKGSLHDHYMALAEEHEQLADKERLEYYGQRQDRATVASVAVNNTPYPGGSYTPQR